MKSHFDDIDRRLMDELQIDAERTNAALAKKLPVSASTIHRRIIGLKSGGCITGIVAVANPEVAGREQVFVVSLKLSSTRDEELFGLERWLNKAKTVQHALLMTDRPEILLTIRLSNSSSLHNFLQKIQLDNKVVAQATASASQKTIKQTLFVPFQGNGP